LPKPFLQSSASLRSFSSSDYTRRTEESLFKNRRLQDPIRQDVLPNPAFQ